MELMDAIRKRVSARSFSDKPISDEIINEMLDAARLAPSGGNGQDWIFGIVKEVELKKQLACAAGDQMWIASAPVVFACCADISWDLKGLPEDDFGLIVNKLRWGTDFVRYLNKCPDRRNVKKLLANPTPLISGEHIFLTAVSHGLSACFIGYLDTEKAGEILGLPDYISCLFLLPVGYAIESPVQPPKKSIEEISFLNTWVKRNNCYTASAL